MTTGKPLFNISFKNDALQKRKNSGIKFSDKKIFLQIVEIYLKTLSIIHYA